MSKPLQRPVRSTSIPPKKSVNSIIAPLLTIAKKQKPIAKIFEKTFEKKL